MAQSLADFTLRGLRPVADRTVVIHDPEGARSGCGVIGAFDDVSVATLAAAEGLVGGTSGIIQSLADYIASINADYVDIFIVWMKHAHPALVREVPPAGGLRARLPLP